MAKLTDFKLRPLGEKDLAQVLAWRNTPRIRHAMFSDAIITWEQHVVWYEKLQNVDNAVYLVFEKNAQALGLVYFIDIDRLNGCCNWGFYLGETGLPHGTGTIMGCLGTKYAFETLKLKRIFGEVLENNLVSQNYHRKMGFESAGVLEKTVTKNDGLHEVLRFVLSREAWERRKV